LHLLFTLTSHAMPNYFAASTALPNRANIAYS